MTVFKTLASPQTLSRIETLSPSRIIISPVGRRRAGRAVVLAVALSLVACGPVIRSRGNLLTDEVMARVTVGQSTQADVTAGFGPPSTISTFEDNVWYYVGERTEKKAFFAPEVTQRRVVKVTFAPDGRVEEIAELGLDDAEEVLVVERETPTLGRQVTFFEQLLGNLGRFNTQ